MPEDTGRFPRSILQVLESLSAGGVPYVVVGGMAMVFHGIPRGTLDVDILVPAEKEVVHALFSLLEKNRLGCSEKDVLLLLDRPGLIVGQWLTFQDEEGREILDVMPENPVLFEAIAKRAVVRESGGVGIAVAGLEDIRAMKQSSGRPVDMADIALVDERLSLDDDKK